MKEEELSEVALRIWEEYISMVKTVQKDRELCENDCEDKPLPEVTWVDEPIT